jgi:hypothetical protein
MPIIYKKPIKAQDGRKISCLYNTAEEARNDPRLANIRTMGKNYTRCLGSALDASKNLGFNWNNILAQYYINHGYRPDRPGERAGDKGIIDSWNVYDVLKDYPNLASLDYDIARGDKWNDDVINKAKRFSLILAKDARGKYTSKSDDIRAAHTMMVIGYLKNGTPLIYDLGKIHEGLPKKYEGKVLRIFSPVNGEGFPKYIKETDPELGLAMDKSADIELAKNTGTNVKQDISTDRNINAHNDVIFPNIAYERVIDPLLLLKYKPIGNNVKLYGEDSSIHNRA